MKFRKSGLLAITLAFLFTAQAQPVRIGVLAGQKYKVETTFKLTSSAEVMGQTMANDLDAKNTTVYEIMNYGSDSINLQGTITHISVNANTMGQDISFDSDKKDNSGPMADLISPKINKTKSITLDSKGNIIKQDPEEESGQNILPGLGDDNVTSIELFIPALAGRELKAGDIFTDTISVIREKFNSRDSGTYNITAIENGVASISYTGTKLVDATIEQMGMEMTTKSYNTVKTEMQVNVSTGIVMTRAIAIESTSNVDVSGMTIPGTGKTITSVKITPMQ